MSAERIPEFAVNIMPGYSPGELRTKRSYGGTTLDPINCIEYAIVHVRNDQAINWCVAAFNPSTGTLCYLCRAIGDGDKRFVHVEQVNPETPLFASIAKILAITNFGLNVDAPTSIGWQLKMLAFMSE